MAQKNVLTKRVTVPASQTNYTVVDPGANAGLIIDWISVFPDGDVDVDVGVAASTLTAFDVFVALGRGFIDKDFRSPASGTGLRHPKAHKLLCTNGASAVEIVVGYHLDTNARD